MADRETFLAHLRDSRLLGDQQVNEVCQRLTSGAPLNRVTAEMVEQGWLTPFQIKRLWAGKSKGLVLGQYRILEELGEGGFGCVFKAQHTIMNRIVALKVISPHLVEDARARSWFRREVLATTQLNHPNIVMAFDANEVDETLFLAMEYVDGPNVDQVVRKQGPLPINLACAMMHQVAGALQYAHEKGMVHRDIKPANLLIPRNSPTLADDGPRTPANTPIVKIVDFGLARLQGKSLSNTLQLQKENSFLGTPDYVSPEQARNIHKVDIRSDLYSLGCTFYFALTGQRPFKGSTVLETVVLHLEKEAEPVERYRPEIPAALASIVRRLMAKQPDHRFQTPAELAAELGFMFGAVLPSLASAPPVPLAPALGSGVRPTFLNLRPAPTPAPFVPPSTILPAASSSEKESDEAGLPKTACVSEPTRVAETDCVRVTPVVVAAVAELAPVAESEPPRLKSTDFDVKPTSAVEASVPQPLPEPAPIPSPPAYADDRFQDAWQSWIAVVEGIAQGQTLPITEANYRTAHSQLMEKCRVRATQPGGDLFRRLESLLAPWLGLNVLNTMDRETLLDLVQRCRAFEGDLGIRRRGGFPRLWVAGFLGLFLACIVLAWLATKPATSRGSFLDGALRFVEANPVLVLAVLAPAIVLTSLYCLSRVFRS